MAKLNLTIYATKYDAIGKYDAFLKEAPLFHVTASTINGVVREINGVLDDYKYKGPGRYYKVEEVCNDEFDATFRFLYDEKLNEYNEPDAKPLIIKRTVEELIDCKECQA